MSLYGNLSYSLCGWLGLLGDMAEGQAYQNESDMSAVVDELRTLSQDLKSTSALGAEQLTCY